MKLLFKETLRKIKLSISRFLSIFFIVGLGVGFFAGIRGTSYDMLLTNDNYYDKNKLMDYKVISTYGLGEDEISELSKLKNIKTLVATYSTDALDGSKVVRVHALEEEINNVVLKSGRMPKNSSECLAESTFYNVGDKIQLTGNNISEKIKETTLEVVGTIESPLYIGLEKGSTMIGNGKLERYIYIQQESFTMDVYTEVYLISNQTVEVNAYNEEYNEKLQPLTDELNKVSELLKTKQYEDLLKELTREIDDAEAEVNREKNNGLIKLNNTKETLDNKKQQINTGFKEIENKKVLLDKEIKQAKENLANAQTELSNQELLYQQALDDYNSNKDNYILQLDQTRQQLEQLRLNVNMLKSQLDSCTVDCQGLENQYTSLKNQYDDSLLLFQTKETEFLNKGISLEEKGNFLENQKQELILQQEMINQNEKDTLELLETKYKQLLMSKSQLEDAYNSYNYNYQIFINEITNAEENIKSKRDELKNIPKPTWYLMDRTENANYTDFKNDALRIDAIAKVFPVFFLLVAALVCLNTMSRMVEEERTQIGTFKALGYSNSKIIFSYIFYVSIATLFGGISGLLIGYQVLPRTIYGIYSFIYNLPEIIIYINPIYFILIILISLVLTNLVTIFSCYKELREVPAALLRPKSPKSGKKVLLEKIPFIWSKINFSGKVTIRNLFRYKKRIFMTIIGIAGCTALMLTGFGLKDSITDMIDLQFEEIFDYDAVLVLNEKVNRIDNDLDDLLQKNNIKNPMLIKQELYSFNANNKKNDFYVFVTSDSDLMNSYINLQDRTSKKSIKLSDDGVIVTEKMANSLKLKVGDFIEARNSSNELVMLKVKDITENYIYHYVYMTPKYYEKVFGEKISYNAVMCDIDSDNHNKISTDLIDSSKFINVTFVDDNMERFNNMVDSLNKIVLVILIASCLLAFVVLYNLTNINIRERIREIATLKVLGFYDREVSNYVYREIIILTLIGIGFGLVLGIYLHKFVMLTAELDFIMFKRGINLSSYILAVIVTIIFSFIVQITTYFKLKKIDMIESLKSVE